MGICHSLEKEIFRSAGITRHSLLNATEESDAHRGENPNIGSSTCRCAHLDGAEPFQEDLQDRKKDKKDKKEKRRHKEKSKKTDAKEDNFNLRTSDEYLAEKYKLEIFTLNPPSPGKKCLVLDIDYTIFDHKSDFDLAHEFKRPYLHEFLKVCYQYYDIIIWSATSMCHIQTKMQKLQLLDHPDFKISLVLSKEFMIPFAFPGKRRVHIQDVKPLSVIWQQYGAMYSASNTIHIDDVVENFALNPQNGLRIDPFKDALQLRQTDRELFYLTQYLSLIGSLPSLGQLDHLRWKDHLINKLFEAQSIFSLPVFLAPPPPSMTLLAHHQNVLVARSEISKDKKKAKGITSVVDIEVKKDLMLPCASPVFAEHLQPRYEVLVDSAV